MTLDATILAEKTMVLQRHLRRIESRLPPSRTGLVATTDASDAVVLHLFQAVQLIIDVATSACVQFDLGTPATYADAFNRLASADIISAALASRLVQAAGFRNIVAHAYEDLDMAVVYDAASSGAADLRSFMAAMRDAL